MILKIHSPTSLYRMVKACHNLTLQAEASRTVNMQNDVLDTILSSSSSSLLSSLCHSHKLTCFERCTASTHSQALAPPSIASTEHLVFSLHLTQWVCVLKCSNSWQGNLWPNNPTPCGVTLLMNRAQYVTGNTKGSRKVFFSPCTSLSARAGLLTQHLL